MARTVQDVITQARVLLQDVRTDIGATYRYSDAELVIALNEAISEARRIRPDLFIGRLRDGLALLSAAALGTALPIDDMMFAPVVNYVVGRAELRDDQYTADGRAVALLQLFQGALYGGQR